GKTPIDRAFEVVQGMTPADNAMSKKSFGAEMMSLSEVLRARGVVSGNPEDAIPMTLEFPDRSRRAVSVAPVDASQHVQWRDLRATPVLYRKFASADPMNRHGAQKNFWYEYIADRKVLYVNYSAVADMPDESV